MAFTTSKENLQLKDVRKPYLIALIMEKNLLKELALQ